VNREVILDSGPLIALLDSRDLHHHWARAQWDVIEPPLLTCEAVVAEACLLARRFGDGGVLAFRAGQCERGRDAAR